MVDCAEKPPPPAVRSRAAGRWVGLGIAVAFVPIWSSGYIAGTIGARSEPSLALVAWRFLMACAVLGVVSLVTRAPWPTSPRVYAHLLITGILLQTVQLGGVFLGLGHGVPAGLSALMLSACPLIVAAAAVPLFSERLTGRQWIGMGVGLLGVAISVSERLSGGGRLSGYAFTVLALAGLAAGTLYQKRFGHSVDLRTGTTIQLLGATLTIFPLAAGYGGLDIPMDAAALGSLAWLAIVNSIGALILLFVLLRRSPGGVATSLLYLVPPATALLAVPILGQGLTLSIVLGMAVSGIGVVFVIVSRPASPGTT
ncbi:DMT family transporter [Actinomadura sp. 6N118]|uniref:DMT family transporter n=1 Tax=Actinomadura sp. 6N118 TaxID=3375151 RepID=UPI00379069C1